MYTYMGGVSGITTSDRRSYVRVMSLSYLHEFAILSFVNTLFGTRGFVNTLLLSSLARQTTGSTRPVDVHANTKSAIVRHFAQPHP